MANEVHVKNVIVVSNLKVLDIHIHIHIFSSKYKQM
jgi:hypothetical protein